MWESPTTFNLRQSLSRTLLVGLVVVHQYFMIQSAMQIQFNEKYWVYLSLPILRLSLSWSRTVILKVWPLDQQPQHHQGNFLKNANKWSAPPQTLWMRNSGGGPAACVLTSPLGDCDAHWSLKVSYLRTVTTCVFSWVHQKWRYTGASLMYPQGSHPVKKPVAGPVLWNLTGCPWGLCPAGCTLRPLLHHLPDSGPFTFRPNNFGKRSLWFLFLDKCAFCYLTSRNSMKLTYFPYPWWKEM